METNQNLLHFFWQAGPIVKAVMLILLAISIWSWTLILQRSRVFKKARRDIDKFEDAFWSGTELSKLYHDISQRPNRVSFIESIFQAGFKEYVRLSKQVSLSAAGKLEGVQRVMRIAQNRASDELEQHLGFLATVGSTSPYIGLFGTVWGIMTAFQALGNVQQATIAMVAPGISEALIATAMGLFAAIPAVIAYNRYATEMEQLNNQYETFQEELSSIIYRQASSAGGEEA